MCAACRWGYQPSGSVGSGVVNVTVATFSETNPIEIEPTMHVKHAL